MILPSDSVDPVTLPRLARHNDEELALFDDQYPTFTATAQS
jgi:hypothetical protein